MKKLNLFSHKNLHRTRFLLLLTVLLISFKSISQNPLLNSANSQMRSIFSSITYPSPNVKFLYDRSAKLSDSIFYANNSTGYLQQEEWMQIYDEMYYAAHDTLTMTTHVDLENYSNSFSNDTIPIGVMDYDWYYCAYNSLTTNVYFNFDTINNKLYDKPGRPGWPFGQSNIFAVSPLRMNTNYINPTFRVDPNLIFSDIINSPIYSSSSIVFRMDFGDGTGWHNFDPSVVSHYQATYSDTGTFYLKTEIVDTKKVR